MRHGRLPFLIALLLTWPATLHAGDNTAPRTANADGASEQAFAAAGEASLPPMATPAVKAAVAPAAELFDLADVRLLDSPFRKAMETDATYLLNLDPNRLLVFLQKQAELFTGTDLLLGWKDARIGADGADWSLGHYLSACAEMYRATGDARMLQRVNRVVDELAACQKAEGMNGLRWSFCSGGFPRTAAAR